MSGRRAWQVMAKELRQGPSSPIFLFAIGVPILVTILVSAVFGDLLDPEPRLGIVDQGNSLVTVAAQGLEGVSVTVLDDPDGLRERVESHDLDAGIILPAGFDDAVRAGARPTLEFFVSGQSLASNRIVLAVTTIDLVRAVTGEEPPVRVAVTTIGDEDYVPIGDRLLPLMVLYAVILAGLFLPAASLVDEREKRTLDALLVTPTRMSEIMLGKATLAVALGVAMGLVTLALNRAFAGRVLEMTLFLAVGAVMMAETGLILGSWAKDINSLYTAIKAGGILIFLPVIFTLFPGLPQWIPRLVPTYYFLQPVYELSVLGGRFGELWGELVIGVAICVALLPAVAVMSRRLERDVAIAV